MCDLGKVLRVVIAKPDTAIAQPEPMREPLPDRRPEPVPVGA